jgi:signal transduction histidine kinase
MRARLLSVLGRSAAPSLGLGILVAASFLLVETLGMVLLRQLSPQEVFGTLYLLGVVVVSTVWGLVLAMTTSVVSAIVCDYFRRWPDTHFAFNPENGVVIIVFLVVALLTNFIAGLARARAVEADQRRREAGALAEQHASLRRVATLVARGVAPSEVFSAVATELAHVLGTQRAVVYRYESDDTATLLASCDDHESIPNGTRFSFEGDNINATVYRTGRAARMDNYKSAAGPLAAHLRQLGIRAAVGAPIIVDGRLWGAAIIRSDEPLPPDTEARVGDFTDLAATAIANAEAHAELTASRARIVAAADDARRRIERDLHDGAQQRLVALGVQLRLAEASVLPEQPSLRGQLGDVVSGLTGVSADLREISHGIHPAILSKGGLGPALKTLARRSAVPVDLDVAIDRRLPDSVEVGAYYVVSEALTNVAKHARASVVKVGVEAEDTNLQLSIRDDGIGGADSRKGSGLVGLIDRVEALGGRMRITSPAGSGTSLDVTIPLDIQ